MDPRVQFALFSALLFGIGGPIAKMSVNNYGLDPRLFVVINGFCSALVGLTALAVQYNPGNANYVKQSVIPIVLAVIAGLVMNSSYLLSNFSLSFRGGSVALTYAIAVAAPLIAISIGILLLNESKNFILHKFIFWTLIAVLATYKAVTSIKPV